MNRKIFSSSTSPNVSLYLSEEVREHLQRHFNKDIPGSKFLFDNPDILLRTIVNDYPDMIEKSCCGESEIKIVSIVFPFVIGNCNVVSIHDISEEELSSLRVIQRGESMVRCIKSKRLFPTKECQLILDKEYNVITAYPGELAPPLPPSPDVHDEYWDNHVFVEPVNN